MPAYRFESRSASSTEVVEGIELPHDDAARAEALSAARDALIDGIMEGVDETDWITRVYDEAGYLIATIAYADVVHGNIGEDAAGVDDAEPDEPGVMRSG